MNRNCDYDVYMHEGVLCIVDLDLGGTSVTNAIEQVLADVKAKGYSLDVPIIYRDSDETWDGVLMRDGRFEDFLILGEGMRAAAIRRAKDHHREGSVHG